MERHTKKIEGYVFLFAISTIFISSLVWGETTNVTKPEATKPERPEEAVIREQMKKEELSRKSQATEKQLETLRKLNQFVTDQQRLFQENSERRQFAKTRAVLNKDSFEAGEKIDAAFVLTNGSATTFLIDGRKWTPSFIVKDEKGNIVLTLDKSKEEKASPPKKEDLIRLERGKTFSPNKTGAFSLVRPGKYTVIGSYTFLNTEEEDPHVWFGTLSTAPAHFQIVEKEKKKD